MDDYSRCVMAFYQWGEAQAQADRSLMAALLGVESGLCPELQRYSEALPLRGKPAKMLVDNGKVYISRRMKLSLADMEIMLIRATPYHAQTKGKIERFFREVHKFEAELTRFHEAKKYNKQTGEEYTETEQEPYLTMSELNSLFGAWLARYHTSQHKYDEAEGRVRVVPLDRWARIERVIEVPEELLRRALLEETTRRVRSDRCISLRGRRYEVPELYLRRTILVRYDPEDLDTIWYYDISTKEPLGAGYPVGGLDNLTREEYRKVQEKDAERATAAEPEKPPVELVTGYTDALKREGEDADTLAAIVPQRAKTEEYQFQGRMYDSTSLDSVTAVDMLERKFDRALDRDERELVFETIEREHILPEVFERTISAAMLDRAAQMHVRVFIDRLLEAMRAARLAAAEEADKKDESKHTKKGWVFER
jgi:transposase InsO family protein